MADKRHPNLEILLTAVERLGSLADELVFLGGCATGLLLTDPAAPQVRVTRDVDVIAEVTSLVDYHHLSERLRQRGFVEDQSERAPVCRWISGNLILDVMPTNPEILGFGNRWFEPALKSAATIELPSGKCIRMVSTPFFLATKLEAFDGRGRGDFVLSSDVESCIWGTLPPSSPYDGRCESQANRLLARFNSELPSLVADW